MRLRMFLRKETFGGLVCALNGDDVRLLDHASYEVLATLADFGNTSGCVDALTCRHPEVNRTSVEASVERARTLLAELGAPRQTCRPIATGSPRLDASTGSGLSRLVLSAPLDLHLETTGRCNLRCAHCYNGSRPTETQPSLGDLESLATELKHVGLRTVVLSGGEPLVRTDFPDVVAMFSEVAVKIVVATNGTILNEHALSALVEDVCLVNVSLDSAWAVDHDVFRGRVGAFRGTLRCIRELVTAEVPVVVQTTLARQNVNSLARLGRLLVNEGVSDWVIRTPLYVGRAELNKSRFVPPDDAELSTRALEDARNQFADAFPSLRAPQLADGKLRTVGCSAARTVAAVGYDGRIAPCALFTGTDFRGGRVWGGRFLHEWKQASAMRRLRSLQASHLPVCQSCELLGSCHARCRAKAYMNGDLYGPDPDCQRGNWTVCEPSPGAH